MIVVIGLAGLSGGCGLSMTIASLQIDEETTASVPRSASPLDPSLDEEDWRRAQAALSLAVDPQGAGLPVNWDNPSTKRKGSFAASGNMVLVDNTICRPFTATLVQAGTTVRETRHAGQACRTGPGEWAMKSTQALSETTGKIGAPMKLPAPLSQPLPARASAMIEALE